MKKKLISALAGLFLCGGVAIATPVAADTTVVVVVVVVEA